MHPELTKLILQRKPKSDLLAYLKKTNGWKDLTELLYAEDHDLAWRSTWLLNQLSPNDLKKFHLNVEALIHQAQARGHSQQRECFKLLEKLVIPEDYLSLYFDWAEQVWMDISLQSSVRISALRALERVTIIYPDLKGELEALSSQELLEPLSPGIRKQAQKIFQSLAKL